MPDPRVVLLGDRLQRVHDTAHQMFANRRRQGVVIPLRDHHVVQFSIVCAGGIGVQPRFKLLNPVAIGILHHRCNGLLGLVIAKDYLDKAGFSLLAQLLQRGQSSTSRSATMIEELNELGLLVGQRCAGRHTRKNRIQVVRTRKFKRTTDSVHIFNIAPNCLQQDFTASGLNQKWMGDITVAIWTCCGFVPVF